MQQQSGRCPIKVRLQGSGLLLSAAFLALAGCRQDMQDQPKYIPLRSSAFWPDHRSARLPVANAVARGNLREDEYFYTGKINGQEGDKFPLPVTKELLERGQQRITIYCTPCHSRVGDGDGMIAQRGLKRPPSSICLHGMTADASRPAELSFCLPSLRGNGLVC